MMSEDKDFTLEVGVGMTSFAEYLRPDLVTEDVVRLDKDSTSFPGVSIKKGTDLVANAQRLPLAAESVGSIFCKDFFGSHYPPNDKYKLSLNFSSGNIGDLSEIAKEWFRVCRRDGKVIILETNTPYGYRGFSEDIDLKNVFESSGFSLKEEYHGRGREGVNKIFSQEGVVDLKRSGVFSVFQEESYVLVFEKP
ncbi:MAG: methyltransferase domain-containing protein [Candidatus Woesebacteria bacterium]|nr:MAG: methyltransferase domain-containing protein [Candidatus Woesebacteria bacterium]